MRPRIAIPEIALLLCCVNLFAQAPHRTAGIKLVMVMPFENTSKVPGIDWIGESFPEVIGRGLASAPVYVIGREDRLYAFDRLGLPATLRPSRATLLRIAQEMDVDYLIVGKYSFDGRTFTASAQLMDMQRLHLSPAATESGALTQLIDVQEALTWDLLHQIDQQFTLSKPEFLARAAPIRLDTFENYIRGVVATSTADKTRYFKETLRISPGYSQAMLQLGMAYFNGKEYEMAAQWFSRVPTNELIANQANFYLGLSAFYLGQFDRAQQAFSFLTTRLPLIEVFNNLGVVESRRGDFKNAVGNFRRAADADISDPDYHFNFGLSLYNTGDAAGAARELRQTISLRPNDAEAKSMLDAVNAGHRPERMPLERIKRNYDETSYRQLAIEIQNVKEQRAASKPPAEHAAFHVEEGEQLMQQGLNDLAENDFREAILLDPSQPAAHLGLARVLLARAELAEAHAQASTALRLQPSAGAYTLLGQIDLQQDRIPAATENADRALKLAPTDASALDLKKQISQQTPQPPPSAKPQ